MLYGRREFPTYNKTANEGDGFQEIFEEELSRIEEKANCREGEHVGKRAF